MTRIRWDMDICRGLDVPPWTVGTVQRPRFARLRWLLRRIAPSLVWGRS